MIRAGEKSDAQEIALVRRRACRVAYQDFVDPQLLEEQEDIGTWEVRLANSDVDVSVEEVDGRIAGFAAVGEWDGNGVLVALYVDPIAQGAGVGSQLHDHALDQMRERAFGEAETWLIADHHAGREFFERRGWEREEGTQDEDPHWRVPTYRYRKEL